MVDAGGEDDDGGTGAVGVGRGGADARVGLGEVGGVREVDGFAFGAGGVDVDEDDLGDEAREEEGVGGRDAYGAGADDDDLDRLRGGQYGGGGWRGLLRAGLFAHLVVYGLEFGHSGGGGTVCLLMSLLTVDEGIGGMSVLLPSFKAMVQMGCFWWAGMASAPIVAGS